MVESTTSTPQLEPKALRDTPALIEHVFPAQKISVEAQKERKAGSGQTLTALGSYWKGRKPLIMVRALVLGSLLPATDDLATDLHIFEKLMAIDDDAFIRREPKLKASDLSERVELSNPWRYFDYSIQGNQLDERDVDDLQFPIDTDDFPGLRIRWKRAIDDADKEALIAEALRGMTYEEKVRWCKRPEECDPEDLYGPIWPEVNRHLAQFGVQAHSFEELTEQLGVLRYGKRPKVGDTFCGAGSIPFEAARLGCDVYASDLNPVGCMLTWGAFNIIGASPEKRAEIERAQQEVADAVDQEITQLGIEHNARGDRAKAFLYCLETKCPQTGWMVPMAPSWVISTSRKAYAKLVPNYDERRFDIEVVTNASKREMEAAKKGTVQDDQLVYELDGNVYRTPIRTIRGDYRDEDGNSRNQLRQWAKHDFKPRPDDTFQERLYCIQWYKHETLGHSRPETYFASVTEEDLEREREIERIVEAKLAQWQEDGLVPDMAIEPGKETSRLYRERGWRYWHHLFNPRQLLSASIFIKSVIETESHNASLWSFVPDGLQRGSKLCVIDTFPGPGRLPKIAQTFSDQALNPLFNYGVRAWPYWEPVFVGCRDIYDRKTISSEVSATIALEDATVSQFNAHIGITDPPYADAINYHEITEFFIAWLRKNPPPPFDQWTWDSRRALAIQGTGDDFRRRMVEAYKTMAEHMPDNGLQTVMFTHQDTGVWSDMVSIFWAAGLQVVGAWYIATETNTALRHGGHVQGTVTLVLRKRLEGGASFQQRLLPEIRKEVQAQIESMMHLNEQAESHGETVFNDSDLQMAGYAAALKVLTAYSEIDGRDVTTHALEPRQDNEKTVIDEIVEYASEVANNMLIPERLKELNPETWRQLSGVERFYLRMLAIEQEGTSKLDNYQNFAKAFHVDYRPLMASVTPNAARLKSVQEFEPRELAGEDLGGTVLGELLSAIQELMADKDPQLVMEQIRSAFGETYHAHRGHLLAVAQYHHDMVAHRRPEEAQKAEIVANRIRNESF